MTVSITLPTVGASEDTWGTELNTALGTFKTAIETNQGDIATHGTAISGLQTTIAALAAVASSGSYTDLTDTPTIPTTAADVGAVPTTRTINGHLLNADVTVSKGDVGLGNANNTADADKPVSTAQQLALDAKVPTSRTINGYDLSANRTLDYSDVGAPPDSRTVNGHALTADVTVTTTDLGLENVDNFTAYGVPVLWTGTAWPSTLPTLPDADHWYDFYSHWDVDATPPTSDSSKDRWFLHRSSAYYPSA